MSKEHMRTFCFNENGSLKPKAECRAGLINMLILEDGMDIDAAEDLVDKCLREWYLWGEPTLEELLKDDEPNSSSYDPGTTSV
jgi:hypothetical protein